VEIISGRFDNLEASSPNIPGHIQKRYLRLLENQGNTIHHNDLIERIKIKDERAAPSTQTNNDDDTDNDDNDNVNDNDNDDNDNDDNKPEFVLHEDEEKEVYGGYGDVPIDIMDESDDDIYNMEHLLEQRIKNITALNGGDIRGDYEERGDNDERVTNEVKSDTGRTGERNMSATEIDVCEFESPFQNVDRYKYEVKRFLQTK
jgi:hypothetical protein